MKQGHPTDKLPEPEGMMQVFVAGETEMRVRTMSEITGRDPGVIICDSIELAYYFMELVKDGGTISANMDDGEVQSWALPMFEEEAVIEEVEG